MQCWTKYTENMEKNVEEYSSVLLYGLSSYIHCKYHIHISLHTPSMHANFK